MGNEDIFSVIRITLFELRPSPAVKVLIYRLLQNKQLPIAILFQKLRTQAPPK